MSVLLGAGEQLGVYTVRDTRMQVLTALGLRPTAYLTGLDPASNASVLSIPYAVAGLLPLLTARLG